MVKHTSAFANQLLDGQPITEHQVPENSKLFHWEESRLTTCDKTLFSMLYINKFNSGSEFLFIRNLLIKSFKEVHGAPIEELSNIFKIKPRRVKQILKELKGDFN